MSKKSWLLRMNGGAKIWFSIKYSILGRENNINYIQIPEWLLEKMM